MAKNQYFTKDYVSTALMHQHGMVVSNKSIKLISNFNGVDLVLVQKCYDGKLCVHSFIMFDQFWYSDNKRYVNPITLKELVKPLNK
jgi:uncharacterized protein YegJ (DUF2314 family)